MNAIPSNKISNVTILKGDKLDGIIEAKGKTAMINVSLKADDLPEVIVISKLPSPLYVVDGVIKENSFDLNTINPNDIENINVIKDKAALEKYGEKGKNGVIEINTKNHLLTGVEKNNDIEKNTDKDAAIIFTKAEIAPSFAGGDDEWRKYLKKNLNPDIPGNDGWKAGTYTIIIRFVVHKDGTLSDVTATSYQNSKTAQHCIDLIKQSPNWKPAIQNGRSVNAYNKQPITFVVQDNKVVTESGDIYIGIINKVMLPTQKDTYDVRADISNGTINSTSNYYSVNVSPIGLLRITVLKKGTNQILYNLNFKATRLPDYTKEVPVIKLDDYLKQEISL